MVCTFKSTSSKSISRVLLVDVVGVVVLKTKVSLASMAKMKKKISMIQVLKVDETKAGHETDV